jgi:anti-anti-sigma regulatory factor
VPKLSVRTVLNLPLDTTSAGGRLTVLSLSGVADAETCPVLDSILPAWGHSELILDLSRMEHVSPAALELLVRHAAACAAEGRSLRLAACPDNVTSALSAGDAPGPGTKCHRSVLAAVAAFLDEAAAVSPAEQAEILSAVARPQQEAAGLRRSRLTWSLIARAQGMLMERYRLRDPQAAMDLLKEASQRHNIRLRRLASALANAPAPSPGGEWFPRRGRLPVPQAPTVARLTDVDARQAPLSVFLDAVRDAACAAAGTDMAALFLTDPATAALWLESHRGFPHEFSDHFSVVDHGSTAWWHSARQGQRVVVPDVVADPVHDHDARCRLLAAGSRSLQCTPAVGPMGKVQGILSTHHPHPNPGYTAAQFAVLDSCAEEAGTWLSWHHRTRLLDAMEYLHQRAVEASPRSRQGTPRAAPQTVRPR